MTVFHITPEYIVSRLNALPPHSRLRPGYCDLMRAIRRDELLLDQLEGDLLAALEAELGRDPGFAQTAGMV